MVLSPLLFFFSPVVLVSAVVSLLSLISFPPTAFSVFNFVQLSRIAKCKLNKLERKLCHLLFFAQECKLIEE